MIKKIKTFLKNTFKKKQKHYTYIRSDFEAIKSDWEMVGKDIYSAVKREV